MKKKTLLAGLILLVGRTARSSAIVDMTTLVNPTLSTSIEIEQTTPDAPSDTTDATNMPSRDHWCGERMRCSKIARNRCV